ncbi:MAG: NAD-dependent succinate-semialdehyde dehydrogenase [Terriglobia bacterium]
MSIQSINPATGKLIASFEALSPAAIEERLQLSSEAFALWKRTSFSARAELLLRAAAILEAESEALGRLMTAEMGKPVRFAIGEVLKSARGCRYYAEHAERCLADADIATEAKRSYIRYEPVGAVLAIMPWNFPFWQVFRFAAPALMAGNVALLKHAPNVPQCALAIEKIFLDAGLPPGVFQTLLLETDQVPALLRDKRVHAVTLTGSDIAGRAVAAQAGAALKKSVLELGGSDPFIVMASADLERAVPAAVNSRTGNSGQSCIAAKRFIVSRAVADEFVARFVTAMRALKVGDPLDPATDLGPMARPDLLAKLDSQVRATLARGARALIGGAPLAGPGSYYPPTVLVDVPPDSPAGCEELFGPVASVFIVDTLEEALRLANDTIYGLGASLWSNDPSEQQLFVNEIEAGQAFVNAMVASDPRVPFGGIKTSGYGRELGDEGIREFVQIKTVWVA